MMRSLRDVLAAMRPSYWLQNNEYCAAWDLELNWLLDNGYRFERLTAHTARIGEHVVWVANHPYASFTLDSLRPRRSTIARAHRALMDGAGDRFKHRFVTVGMSRHLERWTR